MDKCGLVCKCVASKNWDDKHVSTPLQSHFLFSSVLLSYISLDNGVEVPYFNVTHSVELVAWRFGWLHSTTLKHTDTPKPTVRSQC
jgi:hypothetical protein